MVILLFGITNVGKTVTEGEEINDYRPVTLDELILNNRKFMDG